VGRSCAREKTKCSKGVEKQFASLKVSHPTMAGEPTSRRRVLCLHGWRANPDVMKFQMSALVPALGASCELCFMPGRVEQQEACDGRVATICPPPYYAHWGINADEDGMSQDVAASVRHVASFAAQHGPFHAIIGFSQGGGLASILVALQQHHSLYPLPVCRVLYPRNKCQRAAEPGCGMT